MSDKTHNSLEHFAYKTLKCALSSVAGCCVCINSVCSKRLNAYIHCFLSDVPYLGRKIASTFKPVHEITQDGDTLTVKVIGPRANQETTYTVGGEEYDEVLLGNSGNYKVTWAGENTHKKSEV